MKYYSNIKVIIVIVLVIFAISCRKPLEYPIVPFIENPVLIKIPTTTGIDEKGILRFSFTDGDGDIGLAPEDTLYPFNPGSPYYYNLFITYYEKQNGVYVAVDLPLSNNSRIPVITPEGENKAIKGEIEVELFINNATSSFDTIAYDVWIADRALHESNKLRSPDLVINKD